MGRSLYSLRWIGLVLAAVLCMSIEAPAQRFDLLLRGGHVIDGTGNPWFKADVGVSGGRIAAIGDLTGARADRVVDASGLTVVPGFIDIHSHADDSSGARGGLRSADAKRRAAPNLVAQGITSVIVNPDGNSPESIAEQRSSLERLGFGPHVGLMVGHNTIRALALGEDARRPASGEELERMKGLVRAGMRAGALGLTAGLEYAPGIWSTTDEVVALVEVIAPLGGVFIEHERSSGADPFWWLPSRDAPGQPTMLDSVIETIEIGERTGAVVVASHIKARGANFWGSSGAIIDLIERARARGVRIYADVYSYSTTGSDGRIVLIPDWAREGAAARPAEGKPSYARALDGILADPQRAEALRHDIAHKITRRGGADRIMVMDHPAASVIGKSIAELAAANSVNPVEQVIRHQFDGYAERPGGVRLRSYSLSESDVEAFAARPWCATASDAGIALPESGPVHARFYGNFPRKIRHYAMERQVLSVEAAIRSATSLPAQILGLRDRGQVREGFHADLAVLDLDRLADRATFFEPHQYPDGVDYVILGGEFLVDGGELTWALPGKILTRPSR